MTARGDLAARLGEHQDYVSDDDSSGILCAGCLARLDPDGDSHKGSLFALAAHQADVALAWFQEQTTEERRYRRTTLTSPPVWQHRRVTPWEEAK